jgi:cell wall-associated NlpC family hydrolase
LPRDSYQQEAFTQPISRELLQAGDLIFFGQERVNHVALYLGGGWYIHSSGKEMGRNGIGVDQLSLEGDRISQAYYQKLWGFGRVKQGFDVQLS